MLLLLPQLLTLFHSLMSMQLRLRSKQSLLRLLLRRLLLPLLSKLHTASSIGSLSPEWADYYFGYFRDLAHFC
jgi:hypothetical protein